MNHEGWIGRAITILVRMAFSRNARSCWNLGCHQRRNEIFDTDTQQIQGQSCKLWVVGDKDSCIFHEEIWFARLTTQFQKEKLAEFCLSIPFPGTNFGNLKASRGQKSMPQLLSAGRGKIGGNRGATCTDELCTVFSLAAAEKGFLGDF